MANPASAAPVATNQGKSIEVKILRGPHSGESFAITKPTFTIGRNPENDIVLPNDSKISRTHVRIMRVNDKLKIENLSQRNPIFYNGEYREFFEIETNSVMTVGESELELIWSDFVPPVKLNAVHQITSQSTPPLASVQNAPQLKNPMVNSVQPVMAIVPSSSQNVVPAPTTSSVPIPKPVSTPPSSPYSPQSQIKSPVKTNLGGMVAPNYVDPYKPIQSQRPQGGMGSANTSGPSRKKANNNIVLLIGVLVIAVLFFLFSGNEPKKKSKKGSPFRTSEELVKEMDLSKENIEKYKSLKKIHPDGTQNRQTESAQSYYIKGFRDFRQGQFGRAISSFQAALSFDPNHALAKKYLNQSLKKYEEVVQFNMNQARRYREKGNYRLCKSSCQQVLILRRDPNDVIYREAKQLLDECDVLSKGRY